MGTPSTGCLIYVPWIFDMLGGVDVVVERLYRGISQLPEFADRVWIGEQEWAMSGDHVDESGRRFLRLNLPPPPGLAAFFPRYFITLGRRLPALKRHLDSHAIGVINCHFPTANIYTLAMLKKLGLWHGRLILSFHGSDVLGIEPETHVWRTIASATDTTTACSGWLADQVASTGLWRRDDIQVIANGIDINEFMPYESSPIDLSPRRYILNVGNYTPVKAQDVLLRAFATIAKKFDNVDLVFAGGAQGGAWLNHLLDQAAELGLADRTHFLTDIPHARIPALMEGALLLAQTSKREGFSLVLLEAGLMRRAVVSTAVGGIPEVISSPELGRLVSVDDENRLAEELDEMLNNASLRDELGANLQQHVIGKFSVSAMTEKYARTLFPAPP